MGFRPLPRYIGLYLIIEREELYYEKVSVLSRGE